MSQFDLPRINFYGSATVNPATANNNSYFPLVLYDPVNVRAIMPPRIYLAEALTKLHRVGLFPLPDNVSVVTDERGASYVQIDTITSSSMFKKWACTPLGESEFDKPFHFLYDKIRTTRNNTILKGIIPGGWNYYGGMDFRFSDVKICSVSLSNEMTVRPGDTESDPVFTDAHLMDASIHLGTEKEGAVMIDVIPNFSFYSQVFCDSLIIRKDNEILFKGKPSKASLRFLNLNRVINQKDAVAGSGTFYCAIEAGDIDASQSPLFDFFKRNSTKRKAVQGLLVRYDLSEVSENLSPDYKTLGQKANPASCTVTGCIAPWFERELKSITMGRQLIPVNPYHEMNLLPPVVCIVDKEKAVLHFDMIGCLPLVKTETGNKTDFELVNIGCLVIKVRCEDKQDITIGYLNTREKAFDKVQLIQSGGIVSIPIVDKPAIRPIIDKGALLVYQMKNEEEKKGTDLNLLMEESEFMIATDQTGIYMDQNDDPEKGYRSYSHQKERCCIAIYRKGKPFKGTLSLTLVELSINPFSAIPEIRSKEKKKIQHNSCLKFSAARPASLMYVLFPGDSYKGELSLMQQIIRTGFVINLRVLPQRDYSKYLDPDHRCFKGPITFEVIEEEILRTFDLIYPFSSIITPFTKENFVRGWKYISQRLSYTKWSSASYMPSTRDLSYNQWLLINQWAEKKAY